jgi:ABC-type sugar transport system ATPase subunit
MDTVGASPSPSPILSMVGIRKSFGRVEVLEGVDFHVYPGEVHILAGENGAGKSTLIKILAGVHADYQGTVTFRGHPIHTASPLEANELGIVAIYQELSLVPSMTVADNIFLGRSHTRFGMIDKKKQMAAARRALDELGLNVDVGQIVETLPIGTQQMLEIAKALTVKAEIIIMDEPTSALSRPEVEKLFSAIERLTASGVGIVYITHKMEEIEQIADRITVMRDGRMVGTAPASEINAAELVRMMVGRDIDDQFPRHQSQVGEPRLSVRDFSVFSPNRARRPRVDKVSFTVRAGEILGIAGLEGSGASHLLLGLFGAYGDGVAGSVSVDGKEHRIRSPRQAIEHGIALLTSDRKATGLVPVLSIVGNVTLTDMQRFSPWGFFAKELEMAATRKLAAALRLRAASLEMEVSSLSGGNQQKVALAKWIQLQPKVLLLDQPTRGIDVGAKQEIYQLMNEWTKAGIAIVLISSEMPELLAMSDRVLVMHRGQTTGEFTHETATPEAVLNAAMGRSVQPGVAQA